MNEKLKFLWLNLVQFIVYYDKPSCCNAVVAIGHKDKNVVVIRPEYRGDQDTIMSTIFYITMLSGTTVLYGDGFHIDTWDKRIANHSTIHKSPEPTEEDRFIMEYTCSDCGAEWEMAGSCSCNDHCPQCDAEIEPMKVRDIE